MKLTWFGGTTLRVYIGGEIIVIDAEGRPAGVDRGELLAGAARVVTLAGDAGVPLIDPAGWQPRAPRRAIDDGPADMPVNLFRIAAAALLIDAVGEAPLVILGPGAPPRFGRWADGAVIVLAGDSESLVATATVILDVARTKLIALAVDEQTIDLAIAELGEHLGGAGLVSLEPGLALEA